MEEMPSSWWNRSGYRTCILTAFLVTAIIATVCCSFSFYMKNEQREAEEPLLETPGNLSRIQRATSIKLGSNAKADEFSENKEIKINKTVEEVLADGISTLTAPVNKPKNGPGFPINPLQPTNVSLSVISTTENGKKWTIVAQKNPNSDTNRTKSETDSGSLEDGNPQIDFVPNNDPKLDTNPKDTRSETDSASGLKLVTYPSLDPKIGANHLTTDSYLKNEPKYVTPIKNDHYSTISLNLSELNQGNGELILQNDTGSVTPRQFNLRSVETSSSTDPNQESVSRSSLNDENGSMEGSGDIEMISVSNETIPDTDPNWRDDLDFTTVGADSNSTDDGITDPPEIIAEATKPSDIPIFHHRESGPVPKPLTAAVEQLELPSSFDNHINTEQKFLLKESNPSREGILVNHVSGALNKLMREDLDMGRNSIKGANRIVQRLKRSVQIPPAHRDTRIEHRENFRLEDDVKRSFVGYPSYYGLWYKYDPNRERIYNRESLHKSDEFENIPLSLYMDTVLDRMANVDSAKMDPSNGNQPLYMKKFYQKFANAMPQDPTESGSSSSAPEAIQNMTPSESTDSSPSATAANEDVSLSQSADSSSSATAANEELAQSESTGSSSSAPEVIQKMVRSESTDSSSSATEASEEMLRSESTDSSSSTPSSSDGPYYSEIYKVTEPNYNSEPTTQMYGKVPTGRYNSWKLSTKPPGRRGGMDKNQCGDENCSDDGNFCPEDECSDNDVSKDDCSCDFDCDDISVDFDCEQMCKLRGKICAKKAAEDSLSQDTKILKKNDARVKRNTSSMKRLQMPRHEQESMKPNFDLFSILVPKREIVRHGQ